jgi:DNA-binding IclR family transcriptional regulator
MVKTATASVKSNAPPNGTQAIRRAIEVVRAVAQIQGLGANLSRVAHATGLNITTTFRILRSLTDERLLRYEPTEQNYYVGPFAFELGLAASREGQVSAAWRETIDQIARQTRFTTYLVARSTNEAVCLLCIQGSTPLRAVPVEVGQRVPLGVGSAALALLAAMDDAEIERVIASYESRFDLFLGESVTPEVIMKRVRETRKRGYAVTQGEFINGIIGIGVAVLPHRGMTQFSICVAVPASTLGSTEAGKIAAVVSTAIKKHYAEH